MSVLSENVIERGSQVISKPVVNTNGVKQHDLTGSLNGPHGTDTFRGLEEVRLLADLARESGRLFVWVFRR